MCPFLYTLIAKRSGARQGEKCDVRNQAGQRGELLTHELG